MRGKNNLGLTLVELIIVVVILGILILIVVAYFRDQLFKGNDAKRKGDIDRIKIAAEEYEKDHDCYPSPSLMSCNPGTDLRPYLDKIACDPDTHVSYMYVYEGSSCPKWFKVYTKLENGHDDSVNFGIGPNSAYNYVSGSPNAPGDVGTGNEGDDGVGGGGDEGSTTGFYGCFGMVCTSISVNPKTNAPECAPNYQQSDCLGECLISGHPPCRPQ